MKSKFTWMGLAVLITIHWIALYRFIYISKSIRREGVYLKIPVNTYQYIQPHKSQYIVFQPLPQFLSAPDSATYLQGDQIIVCYSIDAADRCSLDSVYPYTKVPPAGCTIYLYGTIESAYPILKDSLSSNYQANIRYDFPTYYLGSSINDSAANQINQALSDTTGKLYIGAYFKAGQLDLDALYRNDVLLDKKEK